MNPRKYIYPSCRQKTGVDILYGMPTELAFEMAGRVEAVLGGFCVDSWKDQNGNVRPAGSPMAHQTSGDKV